MHIVHELRHILFGHTPALVVPVNIAMETCQNVPLNFLFNITIHLYIHLSEHTSYKFEISQNIFSFGVPR